MSHLELTFEMSYIWGGQLGSEIMKFKRIKKNPISITEVPLFFRKPSQMLCQNENNYILHCS